MKIINFYFTDSTIPQSEKSFDDDPRQRRQASKKAEDSIEKEDKQGANDNLDQIYESIFKEERSPVNYNNYDEYPTEEKKSGEVRKSIHMQTSIDARKSLQMQTSIEARKSLQMQTSVDARKSIQMQTSFNVQENSEAQNNLQAQKSFGMQMSLEIEKEAEQKKSVTSRQSFGVQSQLQEQKSFGCQQSFQEPVEEPIQQERISDEDFDNILKYGDASMKDKKGSQISFFSSKHEKLSGK